jgi:hypothetical protein
VVWIAGVRPNLVGWLGCLWTTTNVGGVSQLKLARYLEYGPGVSSIGTMSMGRCYNKVTSFV